VTHFRREKVLKKRINQEAKPSKLAVKKNNHFEIVGQIAKTSLK
jgi:hypothetical protein